MMKTTQKKSFNWLAAFALSATLVSCQKESNDEPNLGVEDAAIAVAASATTGISGTTTDSVYVVHECRRNERRAAIAESSLPAGVGTYLAANYAGYSFEKALGVYDSNGTTTAYIAVVYYNDKPVALKFDASGNFVKVLEQREKSDLKGKGWHHGGRFQHRGGQHKDTVAITALPANVSAYFTANYAQDTLVKAFRSSDSGYVVVSKNNGVFATNFSAAGVFVNRVQLPQKGTRPTLTEVTSLSSAITTYLESTYPGYVLNKAFSLQQSGAVQGYLVLIDANNTRYGLLFDASGSFVKAKTIR